MRSSSTPGTALHGERLVTNGGRILGVTGTGATVAEARERAYAGCERIRFAGDAVPARHRARRGRRAGLIARSIGRAGR